MVTINPAIVVTMIAATIRHDRVARNSVSSIAAIIVPATSHHLSASEANSSSESGTDPVSRSVTPCAGSSLSITAAARIASLAGAPGISAP